MGHGAAWHYFVTIQMNVMQKNRSTTNEGIKAGPTDSVGLQREEGNKERAKKNSVIPKDELTGEKDADDIVHEQPNEFPTDNVEQDLDEIVHEQGSITTGKEAEDRITEEEDMDELVHRNHSKL